MRYSVPTHASYFALRAGVLVISKIPLLLSNAGQMTVLKRDCCDFVCWTPLAIHVERIYYNDNFISTSIPKLDSFFFKAILPRILCGNVSSEEQPVMKKYIAFAERGSLEKRFLVIHPTASLFGSIILGLILTQNLKQKNGIALIVKTREHIYLNNNLTLTFNFFTIPFFSIAHGNTMFLFL